MKVLLRLACFIVVLMSSLEADKCEEREDEIILVSTAHEIDVRSCPIITSENKGPIIWYTNDGETPISMKRDSRIHQHKDKLWFVPAKVEDSGDYYCAVRNSTYCLKIKLAAKFIEHEPNLCYNAQAVFTQRLPVAGDGQLVCPYLEFLEDENNELPKIQWYKDCKPLLLDNVNFTGITNTLIIANVTTAHNGHYTCRASYTHLGEEYPVSRVIKLITIVKHRITTPEIVSPANETMEVILGSQLQLICNVTGRVSDFVYWKWNGSIVDEKDPVLKEDFTQLENPLNKRRSTVLATLNISVVESKFFLHPFICLAKNTYGTRTAYIQLIHPVPDFHKPMIGILVMVTLLITCSVFIYKVFKIDIVLLYRETCYDFLPKKGIAEVTNENIKKSRRLIVILVRETSEFRWLGNSSQEQIAMYNALIQEGIKVVLLELEKIQDYEKMPESIKFIKQKQGVIRWSGDMTEGAQSVNTRFWKKLRYHMPAQRQPPSSQHQLLTPATQPDLMEKQPREVHVPL
uniref:Interleukin-1 receptor type 1 n=1 Tax=Sus scrofa TaxID=9823 RepID=A0A8D0NG26_PIG